jgi:hypothetical protein
MLETFVPSYKNFSKEFLEEYKECSIKVFENLAYKGQLNDFGKQHGQGIAIDHLLNVY